MTQKPVVVIGGGNGARAFAGHLSLKGTPVRLISSFPAELEAIKQAGAITVSGTVKGPGNVQVCDDDFTAISDANLILVVWETSHPFTLNMNFGTLAGGLGYAGMVY